MTKRTAVWVAWLLWLLSVSLIAVDTLGTVMASAMPSPTSASAMPPGLFIAINLLASLMILAFTTVGALIIAQHPKNRIGWLLCAGALADNVRGAGQAYAWFALAVHVGTLPAGVWAFWVAQVASVLTVGLLVFVFLVFPHGRLPSPRWRPMAWLIVGVTAAAFLIAAFSPWPLDEQVDLDLPQNPLAIAGPLGERLLHLFPILWEVQFALLGCAALALFVRFRRAQGIERQQLKWITSAVALVSIVAVAFWLPGGWAWAHTVAWGYLAALIYVVALAAIPLSIGMAILKYRLYDIDLIIRRTVSYSVLTTVLGLVYFCSVVLLHHLFRLTTGEGQNQFATVVSTLTIAALFTPLRRHVQAGIDRRFYRRKYNAEQVLAAFGETVRNETDLGRMTAQLLRVVQETMQPVHASLWLRKEQRR